jgi:NitT/TauT family transport system permease protein
VFIGRVIAAIVIFGGWELYARAVEDTWTSAPSLIVTRLFTMGPVAIFGNVGTTLFEMASGLAIGVPLGIVLGLLLGRMPRLANVLQPFIVTCNSIPLPALAPLLIFWFGLGYAPKIQLVALVSFFLLFFTTVGGARSVDPDLIDMLRLMGGSRREIFGKVIAPASVAWIFAGLKNAIPYALIAATVGEILLARSGVGFLISDAAASFDMTGLYTALIILIAMGVGLNKLLLIWQARVLRWRG